MRNNNQMGNSNKARFISNNEQPTSNHHEEQTPQEESKKTIETVKSSQHQQPKVQEEVQQQNHQPHLAEIASEVQSEKKEKSKKSNQDILNIEEEKGRQNPSQISQLSLPKMNDNTSNASRSLPPKTLRSNESDQIEIDQNQTTQILKRLIIEHIPISEPKQSKLQQRKRTLIMWLKKGASTEKQKERDAVLIEKGYQLFTTDQISQIKQKFQQPSIKAIKMTTLVLFSYSDFYNNEETVKQLHQYFIHSGKLPRVFIIKPAEQGLYQMQMSGIRNSRFIIQLAYPIEHIKHKIAEFQFNQNLNSPNFVPLKLWDDVNGLNQIYQSQTKLQVLLTKSKVSLYGCLKIGLTLVDQLQQRQYFKKLLKNYAFFQDYCCNEVSRIDPSKKKENYLEFIGMKLLQDPIAFYLSKPHQTIINRTLKYCTDVPENLNNVMLPINLLFYKIKEQYKKECISKRYKNNFICFYEANLSIQELEYFVKDSILQNLGFIKAYLKQYDLKNAEVQQPANVLFIINVPPTSKVGQNDNGYYFIGENQKDIEEQEPKSDKYFSGFSHVLFNLLNSFIVTNKSFNDHLKKYTIELEYGYIASQIHRRTIANFISDQQIVPRHIKKQQQTSEVNYEAVIKYQSNKILLDRIEDQGDCLSLLARYNDSISYYDVVFAKCKTELSEDIFLLSSFQNKKGLNYQLGKNPQNALQYFYNAYNFIRKSKKYSQIKLNVVKCLQRSHQYKKLISFSETLLDIAQRYKIIQDLQKQFLIELYGLIAKAYLMSNSSNYELVNQVPAIIKNYECGLKIIEQIGEYNPIVPDFYYNLGCYYLTVGKPLDGLIYLNKGLLLKKTIYTQIHPSLCIFYIILSVAYVAMHDYSKALNAINSCYFLYCKYYDKSNYRFLVVFELRGKIFALMNNLDSALQSLDAQIQIIDSYIQSKKFATPLERKYTIKDNHIAIFNLIQDKQLNPYFQAEYRKDRSQICKVNILLYQAKICKTQFKFQKALSLLTTAGMINRQQLGETHILNLEIFFLMADNFIELLDWNNAQKILKNSLQMLTKIRKDNEIESVRYYQLMAKLFEFKRDYKTCLKYLGKIKQIYFRIFGRQSLQNCQVSSKIGKINILMGNSHQAKLYFVEHEMAISAMLIKVKNDAESTKLFGTDLENYIKKIQLQQGQSFQNRGLLLEICGNLDDAIIKYKSSVEILMQIIGEYNPKVAKVIYRLGACYLKKGKEESDHAIQELRKSLSILKSADTFNLSSRIEIHLQLSKAYEYKNQLSFSLEELGQAFAHLFTMHRIGIQCLQILQEMLRLVQLIISQPTINYLKNTYFVIAKLQSLQEDKNQKESIRQYSGQFYKNFQELLAKQQQIKKLIQSIETSDQKEQKNMLAKLQQKEHIISLQKIKENFQIRKKLRLRAKH